MDSAQVMRRLRFAGKWLADRDPSAQNDRALREATRLVAEAGKFVIQARRIEEIHELFVELTALAHGGVDAEELNAKLERARRKAEDLAMEIHGFPSVPTREG